MIHEYSAIFNILQHVSSKNWSENQEDNANPPRISLPLQLDKRVQRKRRLPAGYRNKTVVIRIYVQYEEFYKKTGSDQPGLHGEHGSSSANKAPREDGKDRQDVGVTKDKLV